MNKIDAFAYEVHHNESIVVEVTPTNFNDSLFSVRANLDGKTWTPKPHSDNAPRFEFTVSKQVNDIHTALFEFTFIAGSPENAFYDVVVSGEDDEGCPCGFKIRKTTANKEPGVEFTVIA